MKAIGIVMLELVPMTAEEAMEKSYNTHYKSGNALGYEVTYDNGCKVWCPKEIADSIYFKLDEKNDGTKILKEDVENFITDVDVITVGDKTTVVNAHTITGFDTIAHSSCVDPKNYSKELGKQYAMEEVINSLWAHLGFVLQWAKNGLSLKKENNEIPLHVQRIIEEYKELNTKCSKLEVFINDSDIFVKLSEEEQNDMRDQYNSMIDYLKILSRRLNRVGINISEIE